MQSLCEVATALQDKVLACAHEHIQQSAKLVGENVGTKVWAHKLVVLDKDRTATFKEVAAAAEHTLLKPSYSTSIKNLVGDCKQDLCSWENSDRKFLTKSLC